MGDGRVRQRYHLQVLVATSGGVIAGVDPGGEFGMTLGPREITAVLLAVVLIADWATARYEW